MYKSPKYVNFSQPWLGNFKNWESEITIWEGWQCSAPTDITFSYNFKNTCLDYYMDRAHVQPIVMNAILCPLQFPVFMSSSMSPLPHSHPLTPRAATMPRWGKCQHLLCCNSFGLRSRSHVTTVENHCDWISKPTAGIVWLNGRG